MFSSSTQKHFWLYDGDEKLRELREQSRKKFLSKQNPDNWDQFLLPEEERVMFQVVEETALKFCDSFRPPMPPSVVYIGFTYFKRVYLHFAFLDYLAKNVMMACLYLACKVDEFNVNIDEFVSNLKSGTKASNTEVILGLEAELMRMLRFHLTVHGPYRPLEGHLIEIKTKYPEIGRPENLRKACEEFLWKSLLSDVCFLFPPSQIALASILYSGSMLNYDIESYIKMKLCDGDMEKAERLITKLYECVNIVQSVTPIQPTTIGALQEKVKQCMNILSQKPTGKRKSEGDDGSHLKKMRSTEDSDFDD